MSRMPAPLPLSLPSPFLVSELTDAGAPAGRLRRADLARLERGVYACRDTEVHDPWTALGLPAPPHHRAPGHLRALLRAHPAAVLSHETAAHLHGIPFPAGHGQAAHDRSTWVHLTFPAGSPRTRRPEVVAHRCQLPEAQVTHVHGLRVTTLERTWVDLCSLGHPWLLDALVAAGDHCVKRPWTGFGRAPALASVDSLRSTVESLRKYKGKGAALQALEHVRVGADSAPETEMRLALIDAGLGEPSLQHPIDPTDPWSPEADAAYEDIKTALQYDGWHHRSREQQARDASRDRYCQERGWLSLRLTAEDRRERFRSLILTIRRRRDETVRTDATP